MSCGSNSDAKPDFDLIWDEYSVILLFFSKTMKKRPYIFESFCNPALYVLNVLFTCSACMHLLFLARVPKTMNSTISILFISIFHALKIEKIVISITCLMI